jgi:hypothetical protein
VEIPPKNFGQRESAVLWFYDTIGRKIFQDSLRFCNITVTFRKIS